MKENIKYLCFSDGLLVQPFENQVLYVEDKPYAGMHRFITECVDDIQKTVQKKGYEFCSLATAETITTPLEVLNYLFPYHHFNQDIQTKSFVTQDLLPFLTEGVIEGPTIIRFLPEPYKSSDAAHAYRFIAMRLTGGLGDGCLFSFSEAPRRHYIQVAARMS